MAALEGLDVRRLMPEEYAAVGGVELFRNVNAPEDLDLSGADEVCE